MKAYLPFGDWSEDGHRYCDKVLVSINSIEEVGKAQDAIREKYGADLFEGWAQDNSRLSEDCWNALLNEGLPIDYLIKFDENNDWSGISSYDEVFQEDTEPLLSLEFIAHAFIWLLNKFGANMIVLTEDDDIPMICNWTYQGFENVGYGCYDW